MEQVRFPRITGIPPLGPGEELAVPQWMGQRTKDPRAQFAGRDGADPAGLVAPGLVALSVSSIDQLYGALRLARLAREAESGGAEAIYGLPEADLLRLNHYARRKTRPLLEVTIDGALLLEVSQP